MQPRRSWIVSPTEVHDVFQTGAGAFYLDPSGSWRPVLTGQSPAPSGSSAPWPVLVAAASVIGGIIVLSFAAEAVPGALIARYGFGAPWGRSILIGVGSAIAFNMVADLLSSLTGGGSSQSSAAPARG
jgi:hypothetical protein